VYYVRGRRVERMAAMTNPNSFEGMERLETQLRKMGVIAALREAGAKPGDTVYIGKTQLEWGDEM
jgi:GTP-binding protein